jgi:type I restriction enzyme M protein
MPSKRDVLAVLSRDELLAIVDRFELSPPDRRAKDGLVETIASSKKATLAEALPELPRDRLKDICCTLGLDDAGREKMTLVERLTGSRGNGDAAPPTTNGAARRAVAPGAVDVEPGQKLTTDKLEQYLWSAADILRGSIDSSDYKGFIFGMLFLKRLSDRFDEECEALRSQPNADPDDPDEHDFFVPKRARWTEIQRVATGVGEALNKACTELEQKNDKLDGVLAGIDFNDERKLGDAKNRDSVLSRLVQHFSKLDLRNANLSEPDMLGRAYEYLIEKFADDAGKKGGEFYTPRMVVRLIVEILRPAPGMRICDPTCGSGGMLIECAHYLERHGQNPRNLSLYGQEKNLGTWAIARMNTLLHGLPDADIRKGDTIRDPKLVEDGELMLFDRVIANPPFSLDEWGREVAEHDPFGRVGGAKLVGRRRDAETAAVT